MKKINDKGFMISTLIYGIFIMFIILLSALIVTLNYRKNAFSDINISEGGGGMTPGTKTEEEGDDDVIITESELNGLIPVKYVDSAGNIVKDSGTGNWVITTIDDPEWFDYGDGRWANAVQLWKSAGSKNEKDKLTSSDIRYMYVWIPRFEYTIGCLEGAEVCNGYNNEIDIKFVSYNDINDPMELGNYPTYEYTSDNVQPINYYTHPAFENDSPGFWVQKYNLTKTSNCDYALNEGESCTGGLMTNMSGNVVIPKNISECLKVSRNDLINNSQWSSILYLENSKYKSEGVYGVETKTDFWYYVLGILDETNNQEYSGLNNIPSRTNILSVSRSDLVKENKNLVGQGFYELIPFGHTFKKTFSCSYADFIGELSCVSGPWIVRTKNGFGVSFGNKANIGEDKTRCLLVRY